MDDFDMPLFDIKVIPGYYFVAGGGGKKDYGISNGIYAINIETKEKIFFKTNDIIKSIEIVNMNIIQKQQQKTDIQNEDCNINDSTSSNNYLIVAIGLEFLYLIKFNGIFIELNKVQQKVKKIILEQNLYILDNHGFIYGFGNIINNYNIDFTDKSNSNVKVCKDLKTTIKTINDKVVFIDSQNNEYDMIEGGISFLVNDNNMCIIKYKDGISTYKIDDDEEEVPGKIIKIINKAGNLIFYANTPDGSTLYINGNEIKFPKITDYAIYGDIMGVSTVFGDIHIFEFGKQINKINISDIPITGLAIYKDEIKFTILNGILGTTSIRSDNSLKKLLLLSFIFLIIAIAIAVKYKKK